MGMDETQGFVIPFEYFDHDKKQELRKVVLEMYKRKGKRMKNKLTEEMYEGYKDLLKK